MSTLAARLEHFFATTSAIDNQNPSTLKTIQLHALQAAKLLEQAADPASGSSSRAILSQERVETSEKDPDEFTMFKDLEVDINTAITASLEQIGGCGEDMSEMEDVLKELQNTKLSVEYRLLVGSLRESETSTPPFYPRKMKVDSEIQLPDTAKIGTLDGYISTDNDTESAEQRTAAPSLSSDDEVLPLQCALMALQAIDAADSTGTTTIT